MKPVKVVTCEVRLPERPPVPRLRGHVETPRFDARGTVERTRNCCPTGPFRRGCWMPASRSLTTISRPQSRCARPSIGPLLPGSSTVDPSSPTSSCSTNMHPVPSSPHGWTEPALRAVRAPHRDCSRAWRRTCSTFFPEPTWTGSRVAPIRTARAYTWTRRGRRVGIGAGWAPAATRPRCERSASVSAPPNRVSRPPALPRRRGSPPK